MATAAAQLLDSETFSASSERDAVNRVLSAISPDNSEVFNTYDDSPTGIWRYQLSNHLGSAATEVDDSGAVISYEEYHPYGTSAYRAVSASITVSAKRYRYTGMERDEETGLEYHSARYYVSIRIIKSGSVERRHGTIS